MKGSRASLCRPMPCSSVNDEARGWTAQLRALLDTLETERVVLRPGDALLFKNDRVLHGRDAFSGERWLQRAYFTDSLTPFRERTGAASNAFVSRRRKAYLILLVQLAASLGPSAS